MKKLVLCTFIGASLIAATPLAHAQAAPADPQGTSEDGRARGKQLFDAALADVKREDYKSACPKFRASYDADPKASTLLNLGTCYERNGQTASAWGAFSNAVIASKKAGKDEWAAQADERVKALEARLVRLTIVVAPASRVEGLVIERDGTRLSESEWGLAMAVDPGEHVIRARAEGFVAWSTRVTVTEGAAPSPVTVPKLIAEKKSVVVGGGGAPARPPRFWTPSRIGGAAMAGAGLVGLGVGAALAIVANGKYQTSKDLCSAETKLCRTQEGLDANAAAYDFATGSSVAMVVGGVLGVAGAGLFLWAPDKKSYALQVTPATGTGFAGLSARGSF